MSGDSVQYRHMIRARNGRVPGGDERLAALDTGWRCLSAMHVSRSMRARRGGRFTSLAALSGEQELVHGDLSGQRCFTTSFTRRSNSALCGRSLASQGASSVRNVMR